jgi:NADPH-dependent 2,4-dienoyl-CoA reductase/sulfur reductase-like enzyme/nitrite reductase/ring-hydroxylating ferredoxin subunit
MGGQDTKLSGPDWRSGVPLERIADGAPTLGHADGEAVVVVRKGDEIFAIGATCTHYGGPLAEGLVSGDTLRCPWHHACFDLRTGEALAAPALNPVPCWSVERRGEKVYLLGKKEAPEKEHRGPEPRDVVVVGGGAAAQAAVEMLRREGFKGTITMLSADPSAPVDRPNLSKDYLAGTAPEEWIPLRPPEFYVEHSIELLLGARASRIDPKAKLVQVDGGKAYSYDKLLLATGGEPIKLSVPGSTSAHVHYLRSLEDSRALVAKAGGAKRAVVVGASFIGLEAAASLRARGLDVHVVAPEKRPLERVMGAKIGDFVRALHEEHGVVFHLEDAVASIGARSVVLRSGPTLEADIVVVGIGVRPRVELAESAGLTTERGISVDAYLETSAPGIFAAGDIARWPDRYSGDKIRVEHWVVAERQGQIAARNILGQKVPCAFVPFFWSQHYDVSISYVGHAEQWNREDIAGDVARRDCTVALRAGEKTLAVITIGRDHTSLEAEVAFETEDRTALASFGVRR